MTGTVLPFRSIAERAGHEQALQAALDYADSIIATLREPFVVLDTTLRVQKANTAFYRNFQVVKHETEGRFIFDLGNGQWNIPRLRTLLEEILPENRAFQDFDVEHDFPSIGKRNMLLNGRQFDSVPGQSGLLLLAIEDITERRQVESALQASEQRYRRLFHNANDGILILDANTLKIVDANRFMTDLLGYSHEEFVGKELWQIGFDADKLASQNIVLALRESGYVRYDHLPLRTKGNETIDVEFITNVYQVEQRAVAQCNIRNISERIRLERELQVQALALAELDRRKDEFLAMLSHELRNPLAPISNAVHLLRLQQDEDPVQRRARTIIERQVVQMTRLIDDLMEVSRITTGRVQLRRDHITIDSVVDFAVEATRPLIEQHGHNFTVSLAAQPIWLYADSARLQQVVVNLITNAAKYTGDDGEIWLTVAQEGSECVLRLRDTGVGIAPEFLPRIFDLFSQAEGSLDRSRGGLGIGLALVQRLVEMHEGRVEVYSALDKGSEFVVRLPVEILSAAQVPAEPVAQPGPAARPLRVLIVDDSRDAAESLSMLLKVLWHDVRTIYDGRAALQSAIDYLPDIVLLDIGLPELDGYEVAKLLRAQPLLRNMVLVAMTGYGQESDRRRAAEAGFDHHLVKPADFDRLQKILADAAACAS